MNLFQKHDDKTKNETNLFSLIKSSVSDMSGFLID